MRGCAQLGRGPALSWLAIGLAVCAFFAGAPIAHAEPSDPAGDAPRTSSPMCQLSAWQTWRPPSLYTSVTDELLAPDLGDFACQPIPTAEAGGDDASGQPGAASQTGSSDPVADAVATAQDRLATLTESVPVVDQPVASRLPVFRDYFDMPSTSLNSQGDGERIAVGGGRVYITRHTHLGNMDEPPVEIRDAVTLALIGSFGAPPNTDCKRPGYICQPAGIAYYRGKVYVSDNNNQKSGPKRISVWNANGTWDNEFWLTWKDGWSSAGRVSGVGPQGIDVAWGEIWLTSADGTSSQPGSPLAHETRKLGEVTILDYQTGLPKAIVPHPVANPYLTSACYHNPAVYDNGASECQANGDGQWNDLSIVPERGSVYAGYRAIQRGVLPASLAYPEPEGRCDGCTTTLGRQEGTDAPWGMRWLLTANSYCNGCDGGWSKYPELRINEFSVESTLDGRPYLAKRRSWHPQQADCNCSQDVAYFNREVRIDWSGALTKPDWINGTQSVNYIVSDADIFVTGKVGERWYELARNFSRVDLAIDGVVRASSTSPNSSLSYDTNNLSTGVHTLTLTAYLNDGARVVSTNSQLRIDRQPPTGSLDDPGPFVSGVKRVSGTLADAHSGPRNWTFEVLRGGSWQAGCAAPTADVATGGYGCDWNTRSYPDGSYSLRAALKDNVNSQTTNVATTPTRSVIVDNTPPTLTLSGVLWDAQDYRPIHQGDGPGISVTSNDSYSGARSIEILVDGLRVDYVEQGCSGACSQQRNFALDTAPYRDGEHRVEVVARDQAGNAATRTWTIDIEETGQAAPDPEAGSAATTAASTGASSLAPTALGQLPGKLAENDDPGDLADALPCALADATSNFPVFSVGPSFEGLTTTQLIRRCAPPDPTEPVRANFVSYIYGNCAIDANEDDPSCVPPVEIQSWPACERNLALYALTPEELRLPYDTATLNGLPATIFEEGTRIEIYTGASTIVLFGDDPSQLLRAVNVLQQEPPSQPLGEPSTQPHRTASELPLPQDGATEGDLPC